MSLNDMSVTDFAKYTIDNLHRATLANALGSSETDSNGKLKQPGVAGKLGNEDFYDFEEFLHAVEEYVPKSSLDKDKVYRIMVACSDAHEEVNSEFKYNRKMTIDNLVINLWRIINNV